MDERKIIDIRSALSERNERPARRRILSFVLWIVQVLLALLFLFAGGAKLVMDAEALKGPVALPVLFIRFIGVCEVLGGFGLILPGLFRIRPELTVLAAEGLAVIMIGATVVNLIGMGVPLALMTLVLAVLLAFVAYGRWKLIPHRGSKTSNDTLTKYSAIATLP